MENLLKKGIIHAKEELDRFDSNFEKGYIKMHIHDYNKQRNNYVDEWLLAKQRLYEFQNNLKNL